MSTDDKNAAKEPLVVYGDNYTYADYLNFDFEEMVELIRGKIFKRTAAPTATHQRVSLKLIASLIETFRNNQCELFIAPFDVVLPISSKKKETSNTVVQPDLCVICDPTKIDKAGCFGAPDLVVEILSPTTSKKDLKYKYSVYEESGVREYWTVHPAEKVIVLYLLVEGKFEKHDVYDQSDVLTSSIFANLNIGLKEVFPEE